MRCELFMRRGTNSSGCFHWNVYKPVIIVLWIAGYMPGSCFLRKKSLRRICAFWTIVVTFKRYIAFTVTFFSLCDNFRPTLLVLTFITFTNVLFGNIFFWRRKNIQALIEDLEVCSNRAIQPTMKKVVFICLTILFIFPVTGFVIFFIAIFVCDMQTILDQYFSVYYIEVNNNFALFSSISCILFTLFFVQISCAVNGYTLLIICTYVHVKEMMTNILESINCFSASHLAEIRKQISMIEKLMHRMNELFSANNACLIFFFAVTTSAGMHIVFEREAISVPFLNCFIIGTVGYLVLVYGMLVWSVLYVDRKSLYSPLHVYEISTKIDVNDIDTLIQVEMLAKQINNTKIVIKIWTFYSVRRISIINITAAFFSYCFLSIQLNKNFRDGFQSFFGME